MAFDLEHLVDLALFARVVDARSFSGAARLSGIAKSAVSRRIRLLEERLGVQLLRRTTRAVQVTSDGARFYEHCVQLLKAARAAEDVVSGAATALKGLIRISAPVTFSQLFLAAAVAQFQQDNAAVEVFLSASDHLVDASASEFDLILRISRLRDGSFVARRLATDRLVVVGAPRYLDRRGRPANAEELLHHNCLRYTLVDGAAEWRFRGSDGKPLVAPQGTFGTTDGTVLRNAMLAGLGLAVMPHFMIAREVAAGSAELVLEGRRAAEVGIYAVTSSARGIPLRVRALIEHLRKGLASPSWKTGS